MSRRSSQRLLCASTNKNDVPPEITRLNLASLLIVLVIATIKFSSTYLLRAVFIAWGFSNRYFRYGLGKAGVLDESCYLKRYLKHVKND
jgi:hypothetical protein